MNRSVRGTLLALMLSSLTWTSQALAVSPPSQFIAKVYTEALGRAPTESEWVTAHSAFNSGTVTATTLRAWAKPIYMSAEYDALYYDEFGYDHEARLLTLYRGALNREADTAGMAFWKNKIINQGMSWSAVIDAFMSTVSNSEFNGLVPAIRDKEGYGFGQTPVMDLTLGSVRPADGKAWSILGGFCSGHSGHTSLQQCLNAIVYDANRTGHEEPEIGLVQKAVFRMSEPLIIPANVKVFTFPKPSRQQYALYARIIRNTSFTGPVVRLGKRWQNNGIWYVESASQAKLENVWVDGQRTVLSASLRTLGVKDEQANVLVGAGPGTKVDNCVLTNPAGLLNLYARGIVDYPFASDCEISNNLVTGYSTCHWINQNFCDGISISSENANVHHNDIVDATDVGITVFKAGRAPTETDPARYDPQNSWVHDNRIIAAGNSAWAGICADPGRGSHDTAFPYGNGVNQGIRSNRIYTGKRGHFDIGLMIGTRPIPWWECDEFSSCHGVCKIYNPDGCPLVPSHLKATGAVFVDNHLGTGFTSLSCKFGIGIAVSGMIEAEVTGNTVFSRDTTDPSIHGCGSYNFVLDNTPDDNQEPWGSFAYPGPPQGSYVTAAVVNCLGHSQLACSLVPAPPYTNDSQGGGGCNPSPCQEDPAPTLVHQPGIVVDVDGVTVSFSMQHRADQINSIRIFDVSGRSLAIARREGTGSSSVRWDGRGVRPGVYHYLANTNRGVLPGRFVLVK